MASSSSGPPVGRITNIYEGRPTQRTTPEWIDPINGQLEILLLRATGERTLPCNPFIVSKTIESVIGPFRNARMQRDQEHRIQYILSVRNKNHLVQLLNIKKLSDGTPIEIINHPTLNQRKCVVACREVLYMDERELVTELKDQEVIEVKRITRKISERNENVPTPTLILTIRGTVIPEFIYFGFIRVPTRNYYPNPMQCFACYKFGHTSKRCRSNTQLCRNCGQTHHHENELDRTCNAISFCVNCAGEHPSTSRQCPNWITENRINRIRIDKGISYKEAKLTFDAQNNGPTYASKVQERLTIAQNTVCNKCKCNIPTNADSPNSPTDSNTTIETETSTTESEEESDVPMEIIEATKNIKRKNTQKESASEEQKSSEDETHKKGAKTRKKQRHEITLIPPKKQNNSSNVEQQQSSNSTKQDSAIKKTVNHPKGGKGPPL